MDWNDLKYVKAIADAGNVANAAHRLEVHQSTVFRRLNTLEKDLGVRLFERLSNGYVMTTAGEDFCQAAERIETDISALNRRISGQDMRPSGTIRVTMADVLVGLLTPCLAEFQTAYPEIELEVVVSRDVMNLAKRDANIAIRITNQPLETLVGRKIASVAIAVYGSKEYLKIHPNLNNLDQYDWIGFDESVIDSSIATWFKQTIPDVKFQYRSNTSMAILAAVKQNIGLGLVLCYLGDSDPNLVRVSAPIPEFKKQLWILTHEDLRYVTRIRTFIDFVASFLNKKIELIEGRASLD